MKNNDVYSRLLKCMQRQGKVHNGFDMEMAEILSTEPISISYNNVMISSGIVMGSCFQSATDLETVISTEEHISEGLKNGLKAMLNTVKLQKGDQVIVQRVGNMFYIVGKAG